MERRVILFLLPSIPCRMRGPEKHKRRDVERARERVEQQKNLLFPQQNIGRWRKGAILGSRSR